MLTNAYCSCNRQWFSNYILVYLAPYYVKASHQLEAALKEEINRIRVYEQNSIIEQGWFAPAKSSLFNAEKCKHSKEKGDSSPSPGTVAASNPGIAIGPCSRDQYGKI